MPSAQQSLFNILRHWRSVGLKNLDLPVVSEEDFLSTSELQELRFRKLEEAQTESLKCVRCPLHSRRGEGIKTASNVSTEIMLVIDAPEAGDELRGELLSGEVGKILDQILHRCGIDRRHLYLTSLLKCPAEKTPIKPCPEVESCLANFDRELAAVRPKMLVLLGGSTADILLGPGPTVLDRRTRQYAYRSTPVRCLYHPVYVLRKPSALGDVAEDLLCIIREVESSKSEAKPCPS